MALSTLDPKAALIIIDLQKGIVSRPLLHSTAEVVQKSVALAEAFRAHALPVVLVNVAGIAPGRTEQPRGGLNLPSDWTDLIPELNQQPTDHVITKYTAGAFPNTGLEDYLRGHGITQVVIAGIATSVGVESTARQAYEFGFNVTIATDAVTDMHQDAHDYSLTKVFPRLAETGTTRDILSLLNETVPKPSAQHAPT